MITDANIDIKKQHKGSNTSVCHSLNQRQQNSSLVDLKNKNKELVIKINKINKSKTNNLYLTSLKNKVKNDFIIQEYEKLKTKKELEDCTFKPKLNHNYKSRKISTQKIDNKEISNIDKMCLDSGFFERGNAWQNRKNEKYALN